MAFALVFTEEARTNLSELRDEPGLAKRWKAVKRTLAYLEANPRHPHEYKSLTRKTGEKVFAAYAEQNAPAAYRVFWRYGPSKHQITIIAITPHP